MIGDGPAGAPVALTIAGSDSGGGAGLQADLAAFRAQGVFGASVVTALTAQNTVGVRDVHVPPVAHVEAQLAAVLEDLHGLRAVKTGMIPTADITRAVVAALSPRVGVGGLALVVDPVMVATSGDVLVAGDAVAAIRDALMPLATVVTPNAHEAAHLVGHAVTTLGDAVRAGRALTDGTVARARACLVKGGHLDGEPDAVDVLVRPGAAPLAFRAPRLDTPHTHGTGCTYASAIAARLARGDALVAAIGAARAYLQGAIARGLPLGAGHGPPDHGWVRGPLGEDGALQPRPLAPEPVAPDRATG